MGAGLIAWTARGAVACCAARLIRSLSRRRPTPVLSEVVLWTAGWALLAVHVACAFHFQHGWSHAAANEHTARRTAEAVGWNWGGGLYFNYATLAIWGLDVVVMIRANRMNRPAPRLWSQLATMWIGFMVLNATLVFGPRWWWLVAAIVAIAIVLARGGRRRSDRPVSTTT